MQPFHIVILLFSICLLYGLIRAGYDTVQELLKAKAFDDLVENITKMMFKMDRLGEAFSMCSKSAEKLGLAMIRFKDGFVEEVKK